MENNNRIMFCIELEYDIVLTNLKSSLEKKSFLRLDDINTKPFEGELINNRFEITRITKYRKSFIPTIKGTITKTNVGTNVVATFSMKIGTILFLIVWSFLALLFFGMFVSMGLNIMSLFILASIQLVMSIVVYYSVVHGFKREVNISKLMLLNVLKGEDIFIIPKN